MKGEAEAVPFRFRGFGGWLGWVGLGLGRVGLGGWLVLVGVWGRDFETRSGTY